jgi:hypothetical protein
VLKIPEILQSSETDVFEAFLKWFRTSLWTIEKNHVSNFASLRNVRKYRSALSTLSWKTSSASGEKLTDLRMKL